MPGRGGCSDLPRAYHAARGGAVLFAAASGDPVTMLASGPGSRRCSTADGRVTKMKRWKSISGPAGFPARRSRWRGGIPRIGIRGRGRFSREGRATADLVVSGFPGRWTSTAPNGPGARHRHRDAPGHRRDPEAGPGQVEAAFERSRVRIRASCVPTSRRSSTASRPSAGSGGAAGAVRSLIGGVSPHDCVAGGNTPRAPFPVHIERNASSKPSLRSRRPVP